MDEPRTASPVAHREGPPTAKRAQVQAAVLAATEELLAGGSSYADLNVERIATAAGISRTAFYFYFRDKRDLLMRLAADVTEQLYDQADIWFSGGGDPQVMIREALARIFALYEQHGVLVRAIVEVSTYEPDIATFWRGLLDRFVDATARRIEARSPGTAPEAAHATAFALTWMVERACYQQLVQGVPLTGGPLIDAVADIYLAAVYGGAPGSA
ncbi:TetR/AcrR family transcriptional regulator [Baekduia soli]|uniref:TetR/AcrR family transcriptional regulator n=1 Tax=Baekduia soli TaxID=496014 RepID=A0A5B8U3S8_9ACTN|nr:TetR/AcrR family transcriptional regulator [Baekduia soli]QEC47719.1 TetR/AcrR family transcriptional regulator [Baekduia soli]